jgi:hypothetical protein
MSGKQEKSPKRMGRPPKYPGEGPRPTLSVRVRGRIKDRLQEASAKSALSISEEIERRVEKSFDEIDSIIRHFGSNDLFLLGKIAAVAGEIVQTKTGKPWHADEDNLRRTIGHIEAQIRAAAYDLAAFADKEFARDQMIDNTRFAYKGEAEVETAPLRPAKRVRAKT